MSYEVDALAQALRDILRGAVKIEVVPTHQSETYAGSILNGFTIEFKE